MSYSHSRLASKRRISARARLVLSVCVSCRPRQLTSFPGKLYAPDRTAVKLSSLDLARLSTGEGRIRWACQNWTPSSWRQEPLYRHESVVAGQISASNTSDSNIHLLGATFHRSSLLPQAQSEERSLQPVETCAILHAQLSRSSQVSQHPQQ